MAILLALAATGIGALIAKNRMATTVNTLVGNLQFARIEAVTRSGPVTLCPEKSATPDLDCAEPAVTNFWHTGYIIFADSNGDGVVDAGDEVIRKVEGSADAGIEISSGGRSHVTFDDAGTTWGSNTTFKFCDSGEVADPREVKLSQVGRALSGESGDCGY